MAKKVNQPTSVEDVLKRIEAREQKKSRRRQIIMGLTVVGLLGAGAALVSLSDRKPISLTTYSFADLKEDSLDEILQANSSAILVSHPELGTDTVRTRDDYENMSRLVEMSRLMDKPQNQPQDTLSRMQPFVVDVAGPREAGKILTFSIESYDEEVEYLLDFGNGYRRKVDERTKYRYPLPGSFEIKLLATKGEKSSIYSKRFRIDPASQVAEEKPANNQRQPEPQEDQQTSAANEDIAVDPELFAASEATPLQVADLGTRPVAEPQEPTLRNDPDPAAPVETTPAPSPATKTETSTNSAISEPLIISEIEPIFPGGNSAMIRYIQRNYRYPTPARDNTIEGVVIVRFVVNPDGSLSNFKVVKGIGYGCDEEAMRLIKGMPNWVPGEQNGTKVPVYRTIPITFRLLN